MLGNRIHRARKASGLSLRELGNRVELSHAAIKKYEDNVVTPSSDILLKLAKVLKVRVEYFFRPDQIKLDQIQYRNHDSMSKTDLEEIEAKILDQIERRLELESVFPHPPVAKLSINAPDKFINYEDIEDIANKIRYQWKLGIEPISDLIDVFEEHGIKVFKIDNNQYPKFDGLSATFDGIGIVVIGNKWPGDRQRFTLAHELGHLVLDKAFTCNTLDPDLEKEQCCNRFAGAFLLPREILVNILGSHRNNLEPRELALLKQEFGISMLSILHRAEDTGIINHNVYRKLRTEFNERGWSKHEPGQQYPQEKTYIFEQMIFRALAEQYIGESKAAELMNMTLESFRTLRAMESQNVTNHQ